MELNRVGALTSRVQFLTEESPPKIGKMASGIDVSQFPDSIAETLSAAVHGDGLYSIPKLGGDGFSAVFRFVTAEEISYFPDNYTCLPHCFPIGKLVDHWIVWNAESGVIARFHPSDIVEPESLVEDVNFEWMSQERLLSSLQPQTVCHFSDPDSGLRYHRFELFPDLTLNYERNPMISDDYGQIEHTDLESAAQAYFSFVDAARRDGFALVFGPDFVSTD